jgi:[acyl-carrier-protein] S-malonyltransferase
LSTTVFAYAGQSSKRPGMLERVLAMEPTLRSVVSEASERLSRDLLAHYAQGKAAFRSNRDIQVGVFLCSYLHQLALEARGIFCDLSLGLSLGEYNHLVQIGALDFADALALVDARGSSYDQGPAGIMAAVYPLEEEELRPHIEAVRGNGRLEIANYNSPTQHVIAGDAAAVEACLERIDEEEFGVMGVIIEKHIPMHTPMFAPVAEIFHPHLAAAAWKVPASTYIPNVLGRPVAGALDSPSAVRSADIIDCLVRHVSHPVLWTHSINWLREHCDDLHFLEVGPGQVLTHLMNRRWMGKAPLPTDHEEDVRVSYGAITEAYGS